MEGQLARVRVRNVHGLQETLCVAVDCEDRTPVAAFEQAFERLRLALHAVDRPRLLPLFIDGEDKAAIQ